MAGDVTPRVLREAIADTLWWHVKAYDLAEVCGELGLAPPEDDYDNPSHSKRGYVGRRLKGKPVAELAGIARQVLEEFGDADYPGAPSLRAVLEQLGARGVDGDVKNLIFAADGPKPRLVLRDAISNVIQITDNASYCLVYDRPLTEHGLTWGELTAWWSQHPDAPPADDERAHGHTLYYRLRRSMVGNGAEQVVFDTYCRLYGRDGGFDLPALIPQVYLHYDPYTHRRFADQPGPLARQRMDFLLLTAHRRRIVIEVDGRQHYAHPDGTASPNLYAAMAAEDRALRLDGYEVYRFGGAELARPGAPAVLTAFFERLLRQQGHLPR